jgi:hypothetical protein
MSEAIDPGRAQAVEQFITEIQQRLVIPADEVEARADKAGDPAYWQSLLPRHPDVSAGLGRPFVTNPVTPGPIDALLRQYDESGYFASDPIVPAESIALLLKCVEAVRRAGWPPVFSFVYDPFWQIARLPVLRTFLTEVLGPGYRQIPHVWTYYIGRRRRSTGWQPHIDGFALADGSISPGRVSVWIPLTDATLENGCMYVVPRDFVPPDASREWSRLDILDAALVRALLQGSRALPAGAGSILGWDFDIIHWGSTCTGAGHSRISIAMEFISAEQVPVEHELSLIPLDADLPGFGERLRAVAAGILTYARFEPRLSRYAALANTLLGRAAQGPHITREDTSLPSTSTPADNDRVRA